MIQDIIITGKNVDRYVETIREAGEKLKINKGSFRIIASDESRKRFLEEKEMSMDRYLIDFLTLQEPIHKRRELI